MQIGSRPVQTYRSVDEGEGAVDRAALEIAQEAKCERKDERLRQHAERNNRLRQKQAAADKLDEMATCALASGIVKGSLSGIDLVEAIGKEGAPKDPGANGGAAGDGATGGSAQGGIEIGAAVAKGLAYLRLGLKVVVDVAPAEIQKDYLAADRADLEIVAERQAANAAEAGEKSQEASARQAEVLSLLKEIDNKRNAATMEVMRG